MRRFNRATAELISFHIMRKAICVLLIAFRTMSAASPAQKPKSVRPDFKDFAVKRIYTGAPVAPILESSPADFPHYDS
jgi:hypothetical protein